VSKNKLTKEIVTLMLVFSFALGTIIGCNDDNGDGGGFGGPPPGPAPTPAIDSLNYMGIGIDYDPEARCADNCNPAWAPGCNPVSCNPQPSFACNQNGLSNNPCNCQQCYDSDLNTIKNTLGLGAITIYQPNYFILTAAQQSGIKVIFGTFNDTVAGLAEPDINTNCTYGGSPLPFCGTNYASVLFDGACGKTTPFNPTSS